MYSKIDILIFICVINASFVYAEQINTSEIQTLIRLQNIDEYLQQQISIPAGKNDVELVIKRTDQLQKMLSYAEEHGNNDVAEKIEKAIETIYEKAIESYPDNIRLYDYYGSYLYDYKMDYVNSVELWQKAFKLNPNDASINNNLALHYFHIGEYDRGWEHLQNAIKYGENEPNILYNTAQIFIIHRNQIQERTGWDKEKIYRKAMEYSEKATKLKPDDFELCKDYALNFFTAFQFGLPVDGKKSAHAWQKARKLARNEDEVFYTWLNEGRAWLAVKKVDNAKQCLLEALKIKPNSKITKDILEQIESGEIKNYFENEKKKSYSNKQEYKNPLISPFKNFTGRKKSKNLLPQLDENKLQQKK